MNTKQCVIIGVIILLVILFLYKKQENADFSGTLSNEAIQNIAKVYNNQDMTVTNLNVTAWKGMVTMWSGAIDKIPSGWALCDGTNGTPDLRGRFVLGYNKDAPEVNGGSDDNGNSLINTGSRTGPYFSDTLNKNGGEVKHRLTTKEIPSHTHSFYLFTSMNNWTNSAPTIGMVGTDNKNLRTQGTDGGNVGNGPSTPNTQHNTLPPYLVLAYIIKL